MSEKTLNEFIESAGLKYRSVEDGDITNEILEFYEQIRKNDKNSRAALNKSEFYKVSKKGYRSNRLSESSIFF